jgi:hypothetical protein
MRLALHCIALAALFFVPGCGTPYQGIKFRAQSPPVEEALRKISLAVSVDGYETESILPSGFGLITKWRGLKPQEVPKNADTLGMSRTESSLNLRLEPRGRMYDVFCTPSLRYTMRDGTVREEIADATHPLREKWERVFRQILESEQKEED